MNFFYLIVTCLFSLCSPVFGQKMIKEIRLNDSTKLLLEQTPFDTSEHNISFTTNGYVYLIDSGLVFGTDGMMPQYILSKAQLIVNDIIFELNTSSMYNPNIESIDTQFLSLTRNYCGIVLRGIFSIGAGHYGVEWIIVDRQSFRTILTHDWEIIDNEFITSP